MGLSHRHRGQRARSVLLRLGAALGTETGAEAGTEEEVKTSERPTGGHVFECVRVSPDGWLVLAPWVQTVEGHWWRPHLDAYGVHQFGDDARIWGEHLAQHINDSFLSERDALMSQVKMLEAQLLVVTSERDFLQGYLDAVKREEGTP